MENFFSSGSGSVLSSKLYNGARVVARTDAGAADVQRHFAGREEIVHHRCAFGVREAAEHVAEASVMAAPKPSISCFFALVFN